MTGFDFSRNQKLALCALIGMSAVGLSSITAQRAVNDGAVVLHEAAGGSASAGVESSGGTESAVVICHVAGCVRRPGVYTLSAGKRVMDAVRAAGGGTDDANLDSLNLAARVEDGSKIEVPSRQDAAVAQVQSAVAAVSGQRSPSTRSASPDKLSTPGQGSVNINNAGAEELQRLPGVGPATAEKILAYRRQCGRFRNAEQLMDVSGIGPKTFEKMRPFVKI